MKENAPKILLTGGHAATTGIAVVEEVRQRQNLKQAEIYWIGSQTAIEGTKISTMESRVFPRIGVKFIPILAGKIQTKFTMHTIPSILKIPIGFFQAFWYLIKIKPRLTISFGGYSSFPVVFWSWIFGIPVILHEQTTVFGRATISSAFFAREVALARVESQKYFPGVKSVITGNPLMVNILNVKPKATPGKPPVILIVGGSRGSNFLNELIIDAAKELLNDFVIIHITGTRDFEKVEKFKENLPYKLKQNYLTYLSVDPLEMGNYYSKADIIVSRSGANSVSEIIYVKRPAIFIPLPRTFMGEQVKNARYAEKFGLATTFIEKDVNSQVIINEINRLAKNWVKIVDESSKNISPDIEASKNVVNLISRYV